MGAAQVLHRRALRLPDHPALHRALQGSLQGRRRRAHRQRRGGRHRAGAETGRGLAPLHPDRERPELRHGDGGGPPGLDRRRADLGAPMTALSAWLVSFVVFQPLLASLLVALLPQNEKRLTRAWTFLAMLLNFALTVLLYTQFDPKGPEFQLEQRLPWIPDLGISYHVGVDGLAVSLMLLTGFLGPLVVLASWTFIENRVKSFHLSLLLIQTAMLGALASLDIILFYIFFEAMLVPMYLIIGVWGSEERTKAAIKFFLYTLAGSLIMLVAILAVYFLAQPAGARSFDYGAFYNSLAPANRELAACLAGKAISCESLSPLAVALRSYGPWMFLAFAVAFAIKVPMFPVHTWLPDAHTEAPVAGSIILAGVMLKMGTFGFWRYAIPFFPVAAQQMRVAFAVLSVVGIV